MSFDINSFRKEIKQQYKDQKVLSPKQDQTAEKDVAINNKKHLSSVLVAGVVRAGDAILISITGYALYVSYLSSQSNISTSLYILLIILMTPMSIMTLQSFQSYTLHTLLSVKSQIAKLWSGWTLAFLGLIGIMLITGVYVEVSRFWLMFYYVLGFAGLMTFRTLSAFYLRSKLRSGQLTRNLIIVGGGTHGQNLIASLEKQNDPKLKICGVFDDRSPERIGTSVSGYPILGTVQDLVTFARKNRVDLLIVSLPLKAETRLQQIFKTLWVLPIDIRLSAQNKHFTYNPQSCSYIGQTQMIKMYDNPISDWDAVLKSVFDKVIALIAFILLSPVMLITALAVKWESKGPALFKQKRYGFNNELVEVYKFRSMYTDLSDADAAKLVTKEDPRVTKVGRFIRKTSLDELPQLFNVLRGDLSLVGPRPHAVQAKAADRLYNDVVDGYFARHKVKPGITGWAQINGWRGETDTDEKIQKRVDCDLDYIENWSLMLDLYILLKTPLSLLNTKNAY